MHDDRHDIKDRKSSRKDTADTRRRARFTETSAAADGQGVVGKDRSRPADSAAALDGGPAASTGATRRPRDSVLRGDAAVDPSGRSGADTGAGSHSKEGRSRAYRDPADGALRDHGEAGSATAGRDRLAAETFGGPLDPALAGHPVAEPREDDRSSAKPGNPKNAKPKAGR